MSIPNICYRPGELRATVQFPYDPLALAALKDRIPAYAREWAPAAKCWRVDPSYIDTARSILVGRFGSRRVDAEAESAPPEPTPIRATDLAYRTLHLLPSAPPTLIEAAYRCLAKRSLPDTGGNAETIRRLNDAVAVLREHHQAAS